jgi:opacity protein-like surface antigen
MRIFTILFILALPTHVFSKDRNIDFELSSTFGASRHKISQSLGISKYGFGTDIDFIVHKNFKGFGIGAGLGYNLTQFKNLRFENNIDGQRSFRVKENYHHLSIPIDFVYKYQNKSAIYPYVQLGFDNIINLAYTSECEGPLCDVKRDLQRYSLALHTGTGMGINTNSKVYLQFGFKYLVYLTNNIFEDVNDKSFKERPYIIGVNLSVGYKFK